MGVGVMAVRRGGGDGGGAIEAVVLEVAVVVGLWGWRRRR